MWPCPAELGWPGGRASRAGWGCSGSGAQRQESGQEGREAWSGLHIIWRCGLAYLWVFGWLEWERGRGSCPVARQDCSLACKAALHLSLLLLSSEKHTWPLLVAGHLPRPKLGRSGQSTILCLLLLFLGAFLPFVLPGLFSQPWMKRAHGEGAPTETRDKWVVPKGSEGTR